ncbi:MAG: succinate dehydrogenase [Chlamydiota bacterium]|nr:succinate dehydrogenase [Chlamydiota bacterium]
MDRYHEAKPAPTAFFWRRLQSLMGVMLVIFLIEHLLTNSQAALYIGDDGYGFIHAVNAIHNLPYLNVIEILLIGTPFLIHGLWGIKYLMTSKQNAYFSTGKDPYFPKYARNQAYTWQRITSWILFIAIIAHVAEMRFIHYPTSAKVDATTYYMMPVSKDDGLYTLADRLDVKIYDEQQIKKGQLQLQSPGNKRAKAGTKIAKLLQEQKKAQETEYLEAMKAWPLETNEVVTVSPNFGTAELLLVRDTFKNPWMLFLYSLFVIAATYHAFNGFWTFCISWGLTLTARSQMIMRVISLGLMLLIGFLGLIAIWGSYLINLKQ